MDVDRLLEFYADEIDVADKVQTCLTPIIAVFSSALNLYIAGKAILDKDLHKFTYIMVTYKVKLLLVQPLDLFLC